jgi:DNA helicase-2/ATP-dependent DNA helicase PcrA
VNWSDYQNDIFKAVRETGDSLIIEAVAGSGKTSTIVEAIDHVSRGKSVLFLAFNKSIADTLAQKIKAPNAKAMTLHSCGFSAWKGLAGQGVKVDGGKTQRIIRDLLTWNERKRFPALQKLVGLAKQSGIVPGQTAIIAGEFMVDSNEGYGLPDTTDQWKVNGLVADRDDVWLAIMEQFDVDPDEVDLRLARRILLQSIKEAPEVVDFDDMLYMPVIAAARFKPHDVVFVDEAQDTNQLQREMIQRLVAPGGRVIAVGDRFQSIYAFRGASFNAMDLIQETFACKPLPLSITYRCPKKVVEVAQTWVKHIQHRPEAPEGIVVKEVRQWGLDAFKPSDVVLCRITRPLVALAFALIRARVPCRVLGRDIGQGLVKLVEKAKLGSEAPLTQFSLWLTSYQQKEGGKLSQADSEAKKAALDDKCETVRLFCYDLPEDATVGRLILEIQNLFQDNHLGVLTLSTIHKSKGLQFPRVFVLDSDEYMPPYWATDLQTEHNLAYVAATRAQEELYYISSEVLL